MTDLLVISAATSDSGGTFPQYREQLAAAGVPLHVEHLDPALGPPDATIGATLPHIRRLADQFSSYSRLVMTDAFDVSFFGTKEDVIAKIPTDRVLWAAEKNCFTDPHMATPIAARYPERGPHFYANGGVLAGTPQMIYEWTERVERHHLYAPFFINQTFLNILLADGAEFMQVDWQTSLFFCLYSGYPELEFERGFPVNVTWRTHPNFIHASGAWPTAEMWEKHRRSLA